MQLISRRLQRRTESRGGEPLITYYDLATGERTELSAITVTNWVDKTCHLLTDEYGLDPGEVVLLDLARTHPGHWVTAIWQLACWRTGSVVAVEDLEEVQLVVTGPVFEQGLAIAGAAGADLLACSLHPLALPFPGTLPNGVADYGLEVPGQPDQYAATPVPAEQLAWRSAEGLLTQADLAALPGSVGRRLLRPSTPLATVRDGLLAAVIGDGSVVVVVGDDDAGIERVRVTENVAR
ncbi:MAG: TIGR03089 family protein [Microlunatus sp.]|nr:TIGR03089 family protein [Microlunatus sp.]MDN5769915.1 TIGR03089 family protein [Microlunatus sp.]MDN5803178.1 TIGR03089 family protein [Microlunatus sp.]